MFTANQYDRHVAARLLDFFRSEAPWQRSLWCSGLVLTLRETLEASEAVQSRILSAETLSVLAESAVVLAGRDAGIASNDQRRVLVQSLRGNLVPNGTDYAAIAQIAGDLEQTYLSNWAASVLAPQRPRPERAARAIAAHLLDVGFSPVQLHQWCTFQLNDAQGAADLRELIVRMVDLLRKGTSHYKVLVGCQSVPQSLSGVPANFLPAKQFSDWLRESGFSISGVRHNGALLFRVEARDPWAAVQKTVETVTLLESRVALGTTSRLRPLSQAWIEGINRPFPFVPERRRVEVHALHREDKLYSVEQASIVDAALELLGSLNSGAPSPAVAAGWAAIESLVTGPGDQDVVAADRLAAVVACSFPRAELTELSYRIEQQGGQLATELAACATNRDRAAVISREIKRGTTFTFPSDSDKAALSRIAEVIASPQLTLRDLQSHVTAAFRRLYRNRNLVLHGGRTEAIGLRAALRTAAPLVGAGMDRIAHAWFVKRIRPMELAAKGRIAIEMTGTIGSADIVDLLE